MKSYPHNVMRIRKGKPNESRVYCFILILNKKKQSSQKLIQKVGFYQYGKNQSLIIKGKDLGRVLNKGYVLNESVKKYIR
jgi:ribosomal protein S16